MKLPFLGDSYDIVKRSMLRWLNPFGTWKALPMFTEPATPEQIEEYAKFLGVEVVPADVLKDDTDRAKYFAPAEKITENLFLDPDTGVYASKAGDPKAPHYLFIKEIAKLAEARPENLTLIFDMSLQRGEEYVGLAKKLVRLKAKKIHGFAYSSHASFLIVGKSAKRLDEAFKLLRSHPGLPLIDPPNRRAGLLTI